MRLAYVCVVLAFGCGGKASGGGDDQPPIDAGPDAPDPCKVDPANCPTDDGLFVSTARGADTNPGSKAMPLKTIAAGITKAKAKGGAQVVYVAQGLYPEKVTLSEGISLNGGYECNAGACGWTRDLSMFETTIVNQDFEGVLAGAGITVNTLIGGFTIRGKDGTPTVAPGSVGIMIAAGAPTVRGNKIIGGAVSGSATSGADRSVGIAMRSTGSNLATIENNDITGGTAIGLSAAITMESVSGVLSHANIIANVLRSGTARRSDGLAMFAAGTATLVANNDITAGSSNGGASNGIEMFSNGTISNNRINVDANATGTCNQQTQWCAGIATNGATAIIINNVVYGPKAQRSAGVFMTESEVPTGAVILNANYLNGGGTNAIAGGSARSQSAGVVVSIGACNTCGLKGAVGRVRNNILDGGINLDRYGVREDPAQGKTTRVEVLDSNDIWFAAQLPGRNDVLYRQMSAMGVPTDTKSVFLLNGWNSPPTMNNLNDDPILDNTWHLDQNSPCIDVGTVTEAPGKDFDGEGRPNNGVVDIGADETQQ